MTSRPDDWYRDAVVYELHVRAFQDGGDDGIGDFDGLANRLDYLQDLGVNAIWLLPFYPSPLRDDGYDIADYRSVHPDCGSMGSFRRFLREAHRRDLAVITELILNHTSDQHPWFRRARRSPRDSRERDYYVWSDTTERYRDARVIFRDFETSNWAYDRDAGQYYWHRFYSHQPDLNFESPAVRAEMREVFDFWLREGVDGFRLDAVPYLYEEEGTSCEGRPSTHAFLRDLRRHVDAYYPGRVFLAEANQWPEDAAAYFGDDDECHMAFHFPLMPRLFMAVKTEERFPLVDILEQMPVIPPSAQWALFLRNHDELTLEMVTDAERDYMYRTYATDPQMRVNGGIRRRLAPLLQNDRRRIELLNGLLFTLPGTPIVYYGDEIGMGDNVWLGDRNSVRTPMQWSADKNAGFSRANPQSLYLPVIIDPEYHYEYVNVDAQQRQPASLLRWMRALIALRRRNPVLGRGSLRVLHPENAHVIAFVREHDGQAVLVVANLSRRAQAVELDLMPWLGMAPMELLGGASFPPVRAEPYLLTLGPYAFHIFGLAMRRAEASVVSVPPDRPLTHLVLDPTRDLTDHGARVALARMLPAYLSARRWFVEAPIGIETVRITDMIPLGESTEHEPAYLTLLDVELRDASHCTYVIPLAVARGARAEQIATEQAHGVIARLDDPEGPGVLYDALWNPRVAVSLLQCFRHARELTAERGRIETAPGPSLRRLLAAGVPRDARVLASEGANSVVAYGEVLLKVLRRIEPGPNPELECGMYLDGHFEHSAPFGGALLYVPSRGQASTLGLLFGHVPHERDASQLAVDGFRRALEDVDREITDDPPPAAAMWTWGDATAPETVQNAIGPLLVQAEMMGSRTVEMHRALATAGEDPAFAPEPLTAAGRRAMYESMRSAIFDALRRLRMCRSQLAPEVTSEADRLLAQQDALLARCGELLTVPPDIPLLRTHGDLRLTKLLFTGRDFVIIDFGGNVSVSLPERRRKQPVLRDIATMIRSFDLAAHAAAREIYQDDTARRVPREDTAAAWATWASAAFLHGYRGRAERAGLLGPSAGSAEVLLELFVIEQALHDVTRRLAANDGDLRGALRAVLVVLERSA